MKLTTSIFLIAVTALPVQSATSTKCIEDNCLRAIRATNFPTRPGTADCNSYFATIVTPPVSTSWYDSEYTVYDYTEVITETITTTLTTATTTILPDVGSQTLEKRDEPITNTATSIPSYASPCSGSIRYSSACSCIGATHTVTTVESPIRVLENTIYITIPTLTTTTTVTKTSTVQTVATGFAIRVSATNFWNGQYLLVPPTENNGIELSFTSGTNPAIPPTIFTLTPGGALSNGTNSIYLLTPGGLPYAAAWIVYRGHMISAQKFEVLFTSKGHTKTQGRFV
ncbi:hypothetical protein TWF970_005106 [Orbilia oligospora]|uniref:Uncharacterized protein n=1 Tax=Orbilia oligospora TaxID=2813651 RepID=A0A7C8VLK4_ORBOL|nr:hypothetical protein TWF970_005106 [Orbilia oligospora]